jgi:hypothetical protein
MTTVPAWVALAVTVAVATPLTSVATAAPGTDAPAALEKVTFTPDTGLSSASVTVAVAVDVPPSATEVGLSVTEILLAAPAPSR